MDAYILSDLHLGSRVCQREKLIRCLQGVLGKEPARRLILAGDVLAHEQVRLGKKDMEVFDLLKKVAYKCWWIRGNHDEGYWARRLSELFGFIWVDCFKSFISGEKTIRVEHGDVYDNYLRQHPRLTAVGDFLYRSVGFFNASFAHRLKHLSKGYTQAIGHVEKGAVCAAHDSGADAVVCGHTHHAKMSLHCGGRIAYVNAGSWTERLCHYVAIQDGCIELREFS